MFATYCGYTFFVCVCVWIILSCSLHLVVVLSCCVYCFSIYWTFIWAWFYSFINRKTRNELCRHNSYMDYYLISLSWSVIPMGMETGEHIYTFVTNRQFSLCDQSCLLFGTTDINFLCSPSWRSFFLLGLLKKLHVLFIIDFDVAYCLLLMLFLYFHRRLSFIISCQPLCFLWFRFLLSIFILVNQKYNLFSINKHFIYAITYKYKWNIWRE